MRKNKSLHKSEWTLCVCVCVKPESSIKSGAGRWCIVTVVLVRQRNAVTQRQTTIDNQEEEEEEEEEEIGKGR